MSAVPPYDRPDGGEEETRLTRNLNELLQELRVAQLGVQILFAFLLSLPFTGRFAETTGEQRVYYFVALLASAGAASMLIAPVAFHRVLFRRRKRPEIIRSAQRFTLVGLALLVVGIGSAVGLVSSYLLGALPGRLVGAGCLLWFGWWWFALPLLLRRSHPEEVTPGRGTPATGG